MRTIETALWPLERPVEGMGPGVFLDIEGAPALAGLVDGERVALIEPHELRALATVHLVTIGARRFWFGEIDAPNAIEVISSAAAGAMDPSSESGSAPAPAPPAPRSV